MCFGPLWITVNKSPVTMAVTVALRAPAFSPAPMLSLPAEHLLISTQSVHRYILFIV